MRSGRTAQRELSHFIGMQPWVNGGKAAWGSCCNGRWSGPIGLARMSSFKPGEGIGCSGDVGHFWDHGLNQDAEHTRPAKGRNVAMVGASRADAGLSEGSPLPEKAHRLVSKSTGTSVADRAAVESGDAIGAGGDMPLKNQASQRFLDAAGTVPVLVMPCPCMRMPWIARTKTRPARCPTAGRTRCMRHQRGLRHAQGCDRQLQLQHQGLQ
jgi:hypothetical protein